MGLISKLIETTISVAVLPVSLTIDAITFPAVANDVGGQVL